MARQIVTGTLAGVADGPVIIIEVGGQEKEFPLACDVTLEWVYSHMGKRVTCLVTEGKVTQVE